MKLEALTKVSMISRVVTMGKRRLIIEIPREFHDKMGPMIGKQVRIDVSEALVDESQEPPIKTKEELKSEHSKFNRQVKAAARTAKRNIDISNK